MPMEDSPVRSTIDFEKPGKQFGRLEIPRSTNQSGWANLIVPIVCIANGTGSTALVLGGNHGDEYEGQITLLNLARELDPTDVSGRIIIIPCLSIEASKAGTRLWPDGTNFNRSFPGRPDGPVNEQLADFLTRVLFPLADIVCDIHSGGRSMLVYPMSHMHLVRDRAQRKAMLHAMLAWNTDYHMLYIDIAGTGLLPTEAERHGKIVVTTELGGGGHVTSRTLRLAERGLRNVLRHFGTLSGTVETRRSMGLSDAVILAATEIADYIPAPESGIYETLVDPGEAVTTGQAVGRIHYLERPDRAPETVTARTNGIVCMIRALPSTEQGDVVTVVGRPCDWSELE
jgi:predicted deacylase